MAKRALATLGVLVLVACGADAANAPEPGAEPQDDAAAPPIADAGAPIEAARADTSPPPTPDAAPASDAATSANDYDHDGPIAFGTSAESVTNGSHNFTV